jgi:predicted porin
MKIRKRNTNMKTLVIAAVAATALTAGAASAEGLSFGGYGEYAVEAKAFEFGLGAEYAIQSITVSAEAVLVKADGADLELDAITLGAGYALSKNAEVYGAVDLDKDLTYTETTLGVAFKF